MSDENAMVEVDCPDCNGAGELDWQSDPRDPSGSTPMQVQCPCVSGKVWVTEKFAKEIGAIPQ